jgi:starch-binding outer membrane protein, SusD/RagB family
MRKVNNILVLFVLAAMSLFSSCSKDYLDTKNQNVLGLSTFYTKPDDALFAMNACYCPLESYYGQNYWILLLPAEDRVLWESDAPDLLIYSYTGPIVGLYQYSYTGLFRTSSFINTLQTKAIPGLQESVKNQYISQAKALQAMYYFNLTVLWHNPFFYDENSIPTDNSLKYGNSDASKFWNKMKEALLYAIDTVPLPANYGDDDLGRITLGAAKSLLGKAMLYKHYHYYAQNGTAGSDEDLADLALAKRMFSEVISSGTYELIQPKDPKTKKDYVNSFLCNFAYVDLPAGDGSFYTSENNKESVWEVQYSNTRLGPSGGFLPGWQSTGTLMTKYFSPLSTSYKNIELQPDLWNAFEPTKSTDPAYATGFVKDPRAYGTIYLDGDTMDFRSADKDYHRGYASGINNQEIATKNKGLTIPKDCPTLGLGMKKYFYPVFYDGTSPLGDPTNIRIIRYSDVLLMYAEVMYLLGDDGTGLARLNDVRARSGMGPIPALTTAAIIHERDVELATEGFRFLDLIRWSLDPQWGINWATYNRKFVVGKNEYFPYPQYEININGPALKQNPGY